MSQYALAFDLDTVSMKADGVTDSERTTIYSSELPDALAKCGFTKKLQGSVYATEAAGSHLTAIMQLQSVLQTHAPRFCKYVSRIHVFRMDEWSDVTGVISTGGSDVPNCSLVPGTK